MNVHDHAVRGVGLHRFRVGNFRAKLRSIVLIIFDQLLEPETEI